jgi:2-iminoacetate synthase
MSQFREVFEQYKWEDIQGKIYAKTHKDVERALGNERRTLDDFMALISPAAAPYLEEMAQLSHHITRRRFGNTMQMYIPMYLSNECQNICTYCGFSLDNGIKRVTLKEKEILQEIEVIKSQGFEHILLVTGEAKMLVGMAYFEKVLPIISPHFAHISMEVQPLEQAEYEKLIALGLNTVLVYQETYNQENYQKHHPKGKKSNFHYRLDTPDRLGKAGIYKMGLGVLLGLEDWRTDSFFCAAHLQYLEKTYWQSKYSISFPRLRACEGHENLHSEMTDKELVQLICAYRLLDEEVELSISTRESKKFRDNIVQLGVTSMSAGSKTNPGGYASYEDSSLEQFEIDDDRTAAEIADMLQNKGVEAVWKDWDRVMQ